MVIVLIIGVCGSGKTTVGRLLGKMLSWPFVDADGFHPASNLEKMRNGIPLTDKDRLPWLLALNEVVKRWKNRSESGVLACSALKNSYRKIILNGISNHHNTGSVQCISGQRNQQCTNACLMVLLEGSKDLIRERMENREGHFMPPSLLDSQFEILEELENSPSSLKVAIDQTVEETTNDILRALKRSFGVKVTIQSTV